MMLLILPTGMLKAIFSRGPARVLRWGSRGIFLAGNHDHAQLDLLLAGKLVAMLPVVIFYFAGRNNRALLDIMAAPRLDDHLLHLLLSKLAQRVILRLERLDKRITVAAKALPDDLVHPLLHEMIGNFVLLFFERLKNKLPVDQIFQR